MGRHLAWLCAAALLASACQLPARGTPVFVDARAGRFWSGVGVLTEVSPDQERCRVSVRDRALIVRDRWLECRFVHARGPGGG